MKKLVLPCCLLMTIQASIAQSATYNYNDLLYYQQGLYLHTPSVFLNAAGSRVLAGDTATAIRFIREAISLYLDTNAISADSKLKFITQTAHWAPLRQSILANRAALGNPNQMKVVTSDIANFWKVFDQAQQARCR